MKWLGVIIAILSGFGVLQSFRVKALKSKNNNLKNENDNLNLKNESLKTSKEMSEAGSKAISDIVNKMNSVNDSTNGDTDEEIFDNFVNDWNNKL